MKSLEQLLETKRMHYLPMYNVNSLKGLHELILEIVKPEYVIVEVGSFAGVSSDLLARYCKTLYCIDVWRTENIGIDYDKMLKAEYMFDKVWSDHKNIEPIQGRSTEIAQQFDDGSVDMVYLDGEHSYKSVKEDILAWKPKIKPGGWITGHDFILMDVQRAVKETLGKVKVYSDTSWAVRV